MPEFDPRNHQDQIVRVKTLAFDADGNRLPPRAMTGYLVADELVVTCAHDVVGSAKIRVAQSDRGIDLPGELAWPLPGVDEVDTDLLDVAVVRVPGLKAPPGRRTGWGHYSGLVGHVEAGGIGFPVASSDGARTHPTPVSGTITPGEGAERHRLVLTVTTARPEQPEHWVGLSGMAIQDRNGDLLGIVAQLPEGWDGRRLHLVPAQLILGQPRLHALLERPVLRSLGATHPLIKPAFEDIGEETEFNLITARYGQVRFVEASHGSELDELASWCTGAEDRSPECDVRVRMLLGPGGPANTRLAAELCKRVQGSEQKWLAGFAREEGAVPWDEHEPQHPTLVVFDYVERPAVAAKVAVFLRHLDRLGPALKARVRVLLVSRNAQEWREHIDLQGGGLLSRRLRAEGESASLTLRAEEFTPQLRELHFHAAFDRFAEAGKPVDLTEHLRVVADEEFESPLLVHIAALLAARGDGVPFSRAETLQSTLLSYLIRRERKTRWADKRALTTTMMDPEDTQQALHAVAIMTLTTPTIEEAEEFLKSSKLWVDQDNAHRREAVLAVMDLYPATDESGRPADTAAPIEPDLVSEHLLMEIRDLGTVLEGLHRQHLNVRHYARLLHILSLACDHYPERGNELFQTSLREALKQVGESTSHWSMQGGDTVADLFGQSLPRLIQSASNQAGKQDPVTATILTGALVQMRDNVHMQAMAAGLEFGSCHGTRELVELRCALLSLTVRHHRRGDDREALLGSLERLVDTLLELELHGEVMAPLNELLAIRAALGHADPVDYSPNTAQIDRLMQQFLARGLHDDAFTLMRVALSVHRRIEEDDFPFYGKYLRVFDEVHPALRHSGRLSESLEMVREAIRARQVLGIDDAASLGESIVALSRLADMYSRSGNHSSAASTALEAVRLLRSLGVEDDSVYRGFIETVDRSISAMMDAEDAAAYVALLQEAMVLRAWRSERNPSTRPAYAEALEHYGNRLWTRGNRTWAVLLFRRAVAFRAGLASDDDRASQIALLSALYDLIAALTHIGGDSDDRADFLARAAARWQELSETDPEADHEQALVLEMLASAQLKANDLKEAGKSLDRAERIRRQLAETGDYRYRKLTSSFQATLAKAKRLGGSFARPSDEEHLDELRSLRVASGRIDLLVSLHLVRYGTDAKNRLGPRKRCDILAEAVRNYERMNSDRQQAYEESRTLARVALIEAYAAGKVSTRRALREATEVQRYCRISASLLANRARDARKAIAKERDTTGKTLRATGGVVAFIGTITPIVPVLLWYRVLTIGRADGDPEKVTLALSWGVAVIMTIGVIYLIAAIGLTYGIGFENGGTKIPDYLAMIGLFSVIPLLAGGIYIIAQVSLSDLKPLSTGTLWATALAPLGAIAVSALSIHLLTILRK
ncbi:MAG: tetratricopeptide repeat protein [Glycomyces artemisiae]|uniref:Tetratricopeptide repeat protein n=1 Tax=Glycomyces artemisiae TaxID=1076443 RepID=A0A850CG09_9ACTN|nr:tetratricopeptide repeat protein [Glycomyces artemisiae]